MKTSLLTVVLTLAGWHASSHAAPPTTPLVDFQAATFHTGDLTWKDSVHGVLATASGAPAGNGGSVSTSNGSFLFHSEDVPGLNGLTSYTLAVGFKAASITVGGADFYGANGLFGADIPGPGQGDSGIGLTTDGGGQIVAGLGTAGSGDVELYNTTNDPGTFRLNTWTAAVLVVDGSAGTVALYVNGALVQGATRDNLTVLPFGAENRSIGNMLYGIGVLGNGIGGTLQGEISQARIYGTALSATEAAVLSQSMATESKPAAAGKR